MGLVIGQVTSLLSGLGAHAIRSTRSPSSPGTSLLERARVEFGALQTSARKGSGKQVEPNHHLLNIVRESATAGNSLQEGCSSARWNKGRRQGQCPSRGEKQGYEDSEQGKISPV